MKDLDHLKLPRAVKPLAVLRKSRLSRHKSFIKRFPDIPLLVWLNSLP